MTTLTINGEPESFVTLDEMLVGARFSDLPAGSRVLAEVASDSPEAALLMRLGSYHGLRIFFRAPSVPTELPSPPDPPTPDTNPKR